MTENYSLWSRKLEGKKSSIFAAKILLESRRFLARGNRCRLFYHYLLICKYRKYKRFIALCPNFSRISMLLANSGNLHSFIG